MKSGAFKRSAQTLPCKASRVLGVLCTMGQACSILLKPVVEVELFLPKQRRAKPVHLAAFIGNV
eukprot:1158095-Pelagomonas_calceolata.AAC.11